MDNVTLITTFEACANNLLANGFPLPLDCITPKLHLTQKKGYYGICRHQRINGKTVFTIGINAEFAAKGTEKAIINTMYHELLHTLPDCQNHGRIWKQYAQKVKILFGYNVCRIGGDKTDADCNCLN